MFSWQSKAVSCSWKHLSRKISWYGTLQIHQAAKKKKGLGEYLKGSEEDVLKLVYEEGLLNTGETILAERKTKRRLEKRHGKALPRQSIIRLVH